MAGNQQNNFNGTVAPLMLDTKGVPLNTNNPTPQVSNAPTPENGGTLGTNLDTSGNLIPRVPPPAPIETTPTIPESPIESLTPAPVALNIPSTVPSLEEDYAKLIGQSSDLIGGVNEKYNEALKNASGTAASESAAAGLGGSTAAGQMTQEAQAPILAQRSTDLGNIYQQIEQNATELQQTQQSQAETSYQDQLVATANAKQSAIDSIKAMAAAHLDWQNYKKTNPDNYNALVKALGGDPNVADAAFISSIPAQNVLNTTFSGSTALVITQDPVTGKTQANSYDLGVKIPQNWTQDKISNNTVIYHGATWDPKDPSTYQMFAIDPLTGIPTTQVGGATNATMGDAVVANVNDILTQSGVTQDPGAPIDPANVTGIAEALIQHENSQLPADLNNPGDVRYYDGLPGATDSGIAKSDGGTWAKFNTPQDGTKAVSDIVQHAASRGSTFSDFVKSYTGTGSPTTTGSAAGDAHQQAIDGWVKNITNGTATLTNVPIAARTAVSDALANTDSSTLPPIAQSRLATVSSKITAPFKDMPAYQLTSGGQLYLGRINAAMKTPGSVSDQDLLDSLTKLNTGGNAISDAQVKLITDGKSYSDWANTIGNKLNTGGVLSDAQRNQIQTLAQNIFKSYQNAYQPIYEQATQQLKDAGIPKDLWTIPDLNTLTTGDTSVTSDTDTPSTVPENVSSYLQTQGIDPSTLSPDQITQLESAIGGQ